MTSEFDDDAIQGSARVMCGLNLSSFLQDWICPTGDNGDNNAAAGDAIFDAFEADAATPSAANAFADFDTAWGQPDKPKSVTENQRPRSEGILADYKDDDDERHAPRRTSSSKGGDGTPTKPRSRQPRRKSGGEGLNDSFGDMNVSNPEHGEHRKHRKERGEGGGSRSASSKGGSNERRRRPKEGEEEKERSAPRRNRSDRGAPRTAG